MFDKRVFLVLAGVLLAGCQTSSLGSSSAAAVAGQQLLASEFSDMLDAKATKLAVNAEYRALETATPGSPVNWKASDRASGFVVAQQNYSVGSTNCRGFVHTITVDGTVRSASGAACRNEKGGWQVLS